MKNEEEGSIRKGREDDENNKTGGAVVVKARVAPSGAFGLPMSFDLVCRSIVFLDDALCAFPVGHGVLLVESERGRQVAFVPGTPGQRKVTAIAAKKCFGGGSARERSEDFLEQEEEERGKGGGQRRREAGVLLLLLLLLLLPDRSRLLAKLLLYSRLQRVETRK